MGSAFPLSHPRVSVELDAESTERWCRCTACLSLGLAGAACSPGWRQGRNRGEQEPVTLPRSGGRNMEPGLKPWTRSQQSLGHSSRCDPGQTPSPSLPGALPSPLHTSVAVHEQTPGDTHSCLLAFFCVGTPSGD